MVGDLADNFTLKDQFGKSFSLYDNLTKKILLIFYPKDNSLVCTKQLSDYQLNINEFLKSGIKLVGINTGTEKSHFNFANKCNLDFPVLSDFKKTVCRNFKAINLVGGIKRKLVLVGENRMILFEDEVWSYRYRNSQKLIVLLENLQ